MSLLYIVEDEPILAECMALGVAQLAGDDLEIEIFQDVVAATDAVNRRLPDVVMLDVLLSGPDCFTMLNELISYRDTAMIPVILVTSLDKLRAEELAHYGVVEVLRKSTMTPEDMYAAVQKALGIGRRSQPEKGATQARSSAPEAVEVRPAASEALPGAASLAGLSELNQKLSQESDGE